MLATILTLTFQSPMFPFVVPWNDSVPGTATDVSFLNVMPAGKNGPIIAAGGHFIESKTKQRVRFLGTNITAKMAFPSKSDADAVAARLAKLGINIVRFHHLQNNWDLDGGMIWKRDQIYKEIDPGQLDRLDYFVYALKKKGIYSNINLQTTRNYLPEMGFPASVNDIKFDFAKKIDKLDERMIQLQKEYARQLIGRTNPYTGLRYAEDPAVMVVEINNENSLVGWPGESPGAGLKSLPEPFLGDVKAKWSAWLRKKYTTDQALISAWSKGVTPAGPSVVDGRNAWTWENHNNAKMQVEAPAGASNAAWAGPFKITIDSNDGPDWYIQSHLAGIDLQEGATYTLKFKVRSDREQQARVAATLDQEDWHFVGLNASFEVGPTLKEIKLTFKAANVVKGHSRIAFAVGNCRGMLEFRELTLSPGMEGSLVAPSESLAKGNIDLPEGGTAAQMADYLQFLTESETNYSNDMRRFLREDLGFKITNIIDTQISWGGLTSLRREAAMEFADNHAYWQHPSFPNSGWDPKNWVIGQKAMVSEFDRGWGELGNLALHRVNGKPYSISEYCHPAPNDFQAEMMPLYANFAALQDWDVIYTFDYGLTGTGAENDRIQGFFATGTNPAKVAYFPAAALIFRQNLMPIAADSATLMTPSAPWIGPMTASAAWSGKTPDLWRTRVSIASGSSNSVQTKVVASTDKPPVSTMKLTGGQVFVGNAAGTKTVVGFVGGQNVDLGEAAFRFSNFGNGFASLTLTSTDHKPLAGSAQVLLTVMGKSENQRMGWNASRTSVGDQWGKGPTMIEGIPCSIRLKVDGPRKVWALDGNGRRVITVPTDFRDGYLNFTIGPVYQTAWYEIGK